MKLKDRIKGLRRVKASELRPNPKNWRTHPKEQADALKGILAEVGIADVVIARECEDGSLMLIDGHLRTETVSPDTKLPVIVLDVSQEEADKMLITFDPLSAMATVDTEALAALVKSVEIDNEAMRKMIDDLAIEEGIISPDFGPATIDEQGKLDEKTPIKCPECGHEFTT